MLLVAVIGIALLLACLFVLASIVYQDAQARRELEQAREEAAKTRASIERERAFLRGLSAIRGDRGDVA